MNDIYSDAMNDVEDALYSLEDDTTDEMTDSSQFVFPEPLYKLKLVYSCEGVYATTKDNSFSLSAGDSVIIPTRYGKDMALVLGKATTPIGIRPDDVVIIDRKATKEDLEKAKDLQEKEKEAFDIFREKAENHKLDMKLITTHYLLEEQKILFFFISNA